MKNKTGCGYEYAGGFLPIAKPYNEMIIVFGGNKLQGIKKLPKQYKKKSR